MALNNKRVLPTVIVKILQPYPPTRGFPGKRAKPDVQFLRAERSSALVVINDVGLRRKLRDEKVGKAIVIVILKNNAHAGEHLAVACKGRTCVQAAFRKSAVSVVVKKKLLGDIVGHKDVGKAVTIIVGESYSQPMALFRGNAGGHTHILKRAVSPVAIQNVRDRSKFAGRAIRRPFRAARFALLHAPIEIAGNE